MNKELIYFDIFLPCSVAPQQHRHDFHEFFFNYETGGLQLTGEKRWAMHAHDLYFFPAGQQHIGNGVCHGGVIYLGVDTFSSFGTGEDEASSVLRWLLERAAAGCYLIPLTASGRVKMLEIFRQFSDEFKRGGHGIGLAWRILMQQILLIILRDQNNCQMEEMSLPRFNAEERIRHVCIFLQENCCRKLTVEMAAQTAGMSRSHFLVMFRRITGMTFTEYVNIRRCGQAAALLKKGEPVPTVAAVCGFASVSNFYRAFRTITGRRPGDYR